MAPTGQKQEKQTPALEYFAVRFVEVEALLDLPDQGLVAAGEGGVPEVLHALPGLLGRLEYLDGKGREVHAPQGLTNPNLFVALGSGRLIRRTFVRDRSTAIDGKWVYVFRADAPGEREAKCVAELSVRGGRFRPVASSNRRADPWRAKTKEAKESEAEALILQRAPLGQPSKPYGYYFHLSSFQLRPAALKRAERDAGARCVRLDDPFWVDVHQAEAPGNAASPLTLRAHKEQVPADGERGYRVHLEDALNEGIRRAQLCWEALEAWGDEQARLAANPEYMLAKRVQLVSEGASNLRSLVATGLFGYLGRAEKRSARCCLAAHIAMGDLLRWIGEEQRPGAYMKGRTAVQAYHEDPRGFDFVRPLLEAPWGNSFSRAMRDAYEGETDEERKPFWDAVAFVHHRLDELAMGREWLKRNLDRSLDSEEPIADAGVSLVFQMKRKTEQAIPEALGWVLAKYGKRWNERYRAEALKEFERWVKARYGADLTFTKSAERRAFEKSERREWRRARRRGVDALELDDPRVQGGKFAEGAFRSLSLGVEAVNIAFAAQALRDNPRDSWAWVEATGAVLDGYEALGKVAVVPGIEVKLTGRLVALKAVAPLAVVAGVIDIAGGVRGAARAGEGGERFGHMMVAGGATLAIVGAIVAPIPVFLAVLALGIAMQAAGQGLAAQFGPLQRLLRNGRFGDGGGLMAKAADLLDSEVDEPWYEGKKLSALKADIPGQHRALDEILYGFEVKVGNDRSRLHLEIALGVPSQLTELAKWTVDALVHKDGTPGRIRHDTAVLMDSREEKNKKFVGLTDVDPPSFRNPDSKYVPVRRVSVEGSVKLDVRGDGKTVITRPIRFAMEL